MATGSRRSKTPPSPSRRSALPVRLRLTHPSHSWPTSIGPSWRSQSASGRPQLDDGSPTPATLDQGPAAPPVESTVINAAGPTVVGAPVHTVTDTATAPPTAPKPEQAPPTERVQPGSGAAAEPQPQRATPGERSSSPGTKTVQRRRLWAAAVVLAVAVVAVGAVLLSGGTSKKPIPGIRPPTRVAPKRLVRFR